MYSLSCIAVVVRPETLASLQRRDGARLVFTDHADIAKIPSAKRRCGVFGESHER